MVNVILQQILKFGYGPTSKYTSITQKHVVPEHTVVKVCNSKDVWPASVDVSKLSVFIWEVFYIVFTGRKIANFHVLVKLFSIAAWISKPVSFTFTSFESCWGGFFYGVLAQLFHSILKQYCVSYTVFLLKMQNMHVHCTVQYVRVQYLYS